MITPLDSFRSFRRRAFDYPYRTSVCSAADLFGPFSPIITALELLAHILFQSLYHFDLGVTKLLDFLKELLLPSVYLFQLIGFVVQDFQLIVAVIHLIAQIFKSIFHCFQLFIQISPAARYDLL